MVFSKNFGKAQIIDLQLLTQWLIQMAFLFQENTSYFGVRPLQEGQRLKEHH